MFYIFAVHFYMNIVKRKKIILTVFRLDDILAAPSNFSLHPSPRRAYIKGKNGKREEENT